MVKTKLAVLLLLLAACSCGPRFEWRKVQMDGHRTGVEAVCGSDFVASLGYVDTVYHSPSGKEFSSPEVVGTASALLEVQPLMIHLKEVLAYCPEGMRKGSPESALGNWAADAIALAAESIYHRKVDVSIMNLGGIRIDMPKGEVLLDDILSMFPFKNDIVYVSMKGKDLRNLVEDMASRTVQATSGMHLVLKDKTVQSIEVGGEPLDDEKIYGLATIDFLLHGGDGINASRNAIEILNKEVRIKDWIVPYVRTLGASGDKLESKIEGRVTVL